VNIENWKTPFVTLLSNK